MAAPHVAGAWAVLKSVATEANISVSEVLEALKATGVPVLDERNNITKPRIRVQQALELLIPLHPRLLADVDGDDRVDIVGFGNAGVYVARSTGTGFTTPTRWVTAYGYGSQAGSWRVARHLRLLADVDGDGRADIVGFGNTGVSVARATASGTSFTAPAVWLSAAYGYSSLGGSWRVDKHPRLLADVDSDSRADIVGFSAMGVYVSRSTGTSFTAPVLWVRTAYGYGSLAGNWRMDRHPRMLADVNGDGRADIVGFSDAGVVVSRSTGTSFTTPQRWVSDFGFTAGWRMDMHPRLLADVDGDGRADIVGFGNAGVYVAVARSTGTGGIGFAAPTRWVTAYGYGSQAGSWQVGRHPRLLADVDGRADIAGFGNMGVSVSRATSTGTSFTAPAMWLNDYGYFQGWR
jgi:hypothetical protein